MSKININLIFNQFCSLSNESNNGLLSKFQITTDFFQNLHNTKKNLETATFFSFESRNFELFTNQLFTKAKLVLSAIEAKMPLLSNNFPELSSQVKESESEKVDQEISPKSMKQIQAADKVNEVVKSRPPKDWKSFPEDKNTDFSYVEPAVDFDGINLSSEEKKAVEEKALKEFKSSMKALDYSIADASLGAVSDVENNPELTETLNKFSNRTLDMYKAYLEVLQEEKAPFFPAEIGLAKSFGFSHNDIKKLINPCKWYKTECDALKDTFIANGMSEKIAQACVYYLSEHNFKTNSLDSLNGKSTETIAETGCLKKDLFSALKNKEVNLAARNFCKNINNNPDGKKLKELSQKFGQFGGSITTVENLKEKLANFDESQTLDLKDSQEILTEEIKSRLGDGMKEPGYIDPSLMLNLLEGKSLTDDPVALMRHKLYFIYKSKGIANEIAASPKMVQKVNEKLSQKGWQIDKNVCDYLCKHSPKTPIFSFGNYAAENWKNKIRERVTAEETQQGFENSPKLSWAEAEVAANKTNDVAKDILLSPYRLKMSPEEEMTYFKSELGKRHVTLLSPERNTMAFHRLLDASKKDSMQPWIPGKHYFKVHNSSTNNSPYLKAVDALGLPQQAGISGSTDQTLTVAGMLGITSVEELKRLRLMYLGWMTSHDDHSVDEILTSAKSFGVPYTPSPDYHKQIYPESSTFNSLVAEEQARRGFKLPEYYLSKEYASECLASLRKEKELSQANLVKEKLSGNELFMRALVAKPQAQLSDPFQNNTWNGFLRKLNTKKKKSVDNGKVKYTYNPLTKQMEFHPKAPQPSYTGTNKLSVSLVPSHGKILPYKWDQDESVGLLFDRNSSEFKDKYIFKKDALTDNKWWRRFYTKEETQQPDFHKKLAQAVKEVESTDGKGEKASFNHLRLNSLDELIAKVNKVSKFKEHNEILASLHKESILGVFAFNKKCEDNPVGAEYYTLLKGMSNKFRLKEKEGVDVPLFIFDHARDKGLELYSTDKQREALQLLKENKNGEFDSLVKYLAAKSNESFDKVASVLTEELDRLQKYFLVAA